MGMLRVWNGVVVTGATTVKQSFKDDVNINKIMKRYEKNGSLPQMIRDNAGYGDYSDVPSYHEACNKVLFAQMQFDALSVEVKKRFKNDPVEMLEFCFNPDNFDEMVKLGLAIKPEVKPEVSDAVVVDKTA